MPAESRPSKITVDFTGVEVRKGARSDKLPEGDYLWQVDDVVKTHVKDDPSRPMLRWTMSVVEPTKYKGKKNTFTTMLEEANLWALRSFLVDLLGGEDKVPQSKLDIPLATIRQKHPKVGGSLVDDEYKNKPTSKWAGSFPKADWAERKAAMAGDDIDEDDEDEESVKSAATSSDDDEDMDEIDVDDI